MSTYLYPWMGTPPLLQQRRLRRFRCHCCNRACGSFVPNALYCRRCRRLGPYGRAQGRGMTDGPRPERMEARGHIGDCAGCGREIKSESGGPAVVWFVTRGRDGVRDWCTDCEYLAEEA